MARPFLFAPTCLLTIGLCTLALLGRAQLCLQPLHTAEITTGIWAEEITWEVWTLDGTLAAGPFGPYEDGTTYLHELCLEPGCYNVLMLDGLETDGKEPSSPFLTCLVRWSTATAWKLP